METLYWERMVEIGQLLRTRRHWVIIIVFSISVFALPPPLKGCDNSASCSDFVLRAGNEFVLHGQPFFIAGANNHYLPWGTTQEVDAVMNDAVQMHVNVLRTFITSIRGSLDNKTVPTIWNWGNTTVSGDMGMNGTYVLYWDTANHRMAWNDGPDGLQKMDYVIAKARDMNLKLIVAFMNNWSDTGGAPQVAAWYHNTNPSYFFFSDPRPRQNYRYWVNHVLNHVNTLTGLAYKDDPTILAWDLMNEPTASASWLAYNWIKEMSAYVKAIDSNHLVTTGEEAYFSYISSSPWVLELKLNTIDFGTWHGYPEEYKEDAKVLVKRIDLHCQLGASIGKPVVLEEFGYSDRHQNQADVYNVWVNEVLNNPNCNGWLVWRLTAKQENGDYPSDSEGFEIHNDNSATANVLRNADIQVEKRNGGN